MHKPLKAGYSCYNGLKNFLLRRFPYLDYQCTLWGNKPYYGTFLMAGQILPARKYVMRDMIRRELMQTVRSDFTLLEIGSWAGLSTSIWAQECQHQSKGTVFCIDTWEASLNVPEIMQKAAKRNRIYKLFQHNMRCSGYENIVFPIKASSDVMHNILKPQSFDLIFIDGDHAHTQFKKDLINYMPLIKDKGIICGDDLEHLPQDIDLGFARNHLEEDYIEDASNNQKYHPGIAVAIQEVFGSVSMKEGFWAMRKIGPEWHKVAF